MERTNRGGSIISFIVVGVILVALFVGGIYALNRQPTSSVSPVQQQPRSDRIGQQKSETKEEESPAPLSDTSNHHAATHLPATGIKETLGTLFAIGLISGVSISYIRSRRPHLSL